MSLLLTLSLLSSLLCCVYLQTEVLANNQTRLGHDWIRFTNAAIDLEGTEVFTPKELVMVDNIRYMGQIDYLISFVNKHDKR